MELSVSWFGKCIRETIELSGFFHVDLRLEVALLSFQI